MANLVIVRGLPASGKSTAVRAAVRDSDGTAVRVNRDLIRDQLFGTRLDLTVGQEALVSKSEKAQVEAFLKAGVDVYVDAMHLKNKYVREWAKVAAKLGAEFIVWDSFLSVSLEECVRRDALRQGEECLGGDVIRGIHKRFFPIPALKLDDIEATKVEPYVPIVGTPDAYMVDIDGTCTQGPHNRSPYEWLKVDQDMINEPVVDTVWSLYKQGRKIVFCSGRDEISRELTTEWLSAAFGASMIKECPLFMRAEGDNRRDSIVKMELFDKHIRNNYNVIAVFDDRPQVIRMWKSLGLQVFDVAQSEEF